MPDRQNVLSALVPDPHDVWVKVYRKKGEPPVEIHSFLQCLQHASRGGIRAGALGYLFRVVVDLALLLVKIRRAPKHLHLEALRNAFFGETSRQLASSFGTFVFLYRLIYNALPLLLPPPRERTRGLFSLVAGAISAGAAIRLLDAGLRSEVAQQAFVRGLRISYNVAAEKHGFSVPHGTLILWVISCAQICYGFTMRPDTLPPVYRTWIAKAIRIPPQTVGINNSLVREARMDVELLDRVIGLPYIHPANRTELMERRRLATLPNPECGSRYVPCAVLHPGIRGCWNVPFRKFPGMMWGVWPTYAAIHFTSTLLFRSRAFLRSPLRTLLRTAWKISRSALFVSVLIHGYEGLLCFKHWLYEVLRRVDSLPRWTAEIFISKSSFGLIGLIAGLALVIEDHHRRADLLMYILPKAMESAWRIAGGSRNWRRVTSMDGEVVMAAVGMGMVMKGYQCDPQQMSGILGAVLYQLVGPN